MARLTYASICSLDGYTVDAAGSFAWAAPDEEVHAFVNDLERPVGTYLYGRRMYEVMRYWETAEGRSDTTDEYADLWRAADKVVYSTTLDAVTTGRTRLERSFDPDAVRAMKAAGDHDLSIGGPTLAAAALRAGLVDDLHLFLVPTVVGGGTRALPERLSVPLELVDEHRFASGFVHLHYRPHEGDGS